MYSEEKNDPKRMTIQDISWVCKLSKLSYLSNYLVIQVCIRN